MRSIVTPAGGPELGTSDPASYAIIGGAMEVHRVLGPGFRERLYQQALAVELTERGVAFTQEPRIPVTYKGNVLLAVYVPDFICLGRYVVEVKAVVELGPLETAQILTYLKATGLPVGLLLNFGARSLEYKRYVT